VRFGITRAGVEGAVDPVEDVEASVGAEGEEVKGVYDRGDGGLAEEEELWEDTDGFKDYREGPWELRRIDKVSNISLRRV
jgi:hypothetical protein